MKPVSAICLLILVAAPAPSLADMFYPDFGSIAKQPSVPVDATTQPSAADSAKREAWHTTMSRTSIPKKGCFKATYPNTNWEEVPCSTPPNKPYPPRSGPPNEIVGNGNDFSVQAPSGLISTATGFFDSVNGVTSVSDQGGQSNFSLQLNTNFFQNSSNNVPACNGAANPTACKGWQQFIYSNSGQAFMQYWMLNYSTTCPTGWNTYGNDCWSNGPGVSLSPQPIANLAQLRLTGNANSGGTDTVIMATGVGDPLQTSNQDSVLNLAQNWQAAEFNIVGDCCGTDAVFNVGSTIYVRTSINDGTSSTPTCVREGFTGETNNLILRNGCSQIGGSSPAIDFMESNVCLPQGSRCFVGDTCCGLNNFCDKGFCVVTATCMGVPHPKGRCSAPEGWTCCGSDGWECGLCQ